jgi:hypothetical protein
MIGARPVRGPALAKSSFVPRKDFAFYVGKAAFGKPDPLWECSRRFKPSDLPEAQAGQLAGLLRRYIL